MNGVNKNLNIIKHCINELLDNIKQILYTVSMSVHRYKNMYDNKEKIE